MVARTGTIANTRLMKWLARVEQSGLEIVDRFLFNGPNNWNGAAADNLYNTLEVLRDLDTPLLGNTVFVISKRPSQ